MPIYDPRDVGICVSSSNDPGVFQTFTAIPEEELEQYNLWKSIMAAAETDRALKIALDRVATLYYLSEEDNGSKT
jgi:hypothetical protein